MRNHICFWFLASERQASKLSGHTLLELLERHDATVHSLPSKEFEGYAVLSVRFRPPDVEQWKQTYGVDIFGVTGSLDDMPPYTDLLEAIQSRRESERRARPRAGDITVEEALDYCRVHGFTGYEVGPGQFRRHGHVCTLLVLFAPDDGGMQGVFVRLRGHSEIQWCGADGLWPFLHLKVLELAPPSERERA